MTISTRYLPTIVTILALVAAAANTAPARTLDSAFGVDGRIAVDLGTLKDKAHAVLVQPDGKIVVAGSSHNTANLDFALVRFNADGSLDSAFNSDGTLTAPVGRYDDEVLALGLLEDGRILAAGYAGNGEDRDFALARYLSDGSPDPSFGENGVVITPVGNSDEEVSALYLADDGSVLVAGAVEGTTGRVMALGRYLEDGSLDSGFADSGIALIGIGEDVLAQGVGVQSDGRIVVSGSFLSGQVPALMLVAFTSLGEVDSSFGENGIAVVDAVTDGSEGFGILVAADDGITVAGSVGVAPNRDAALFRFTSSGEIDATFGEQGVLVTQAGNEDDVLFAVAAGEEGLNASGYTTENGAREFLVVSYQEESGVEILDETESASDSESTQMTFRELTVVDDSLDDYTTTEASESTPSTEVLTTTFGSADAISYALAVQADGKIVAAGTSSEDSEDSSIVVARYTASESTKAGTDDTSTADDTSSTVTSGGTSGYVKTKDVTNVTRTTANTGGEIYAGIGTVTARGVVYSTLPDPIYEDASSSGGSSSDFTVKITAPADGTVLSVNSTSTSLSVTTGVEASCTFSVTDSSSNAIDSGQLGSTDKINHSSTISGLSNGGSYTCSVSCEGDDSTTGSASSSFTVSSADQTSLINSIKVRSLDVVSNFLVAEANAEETTTSSSDSTTTTSTRNIFDTDKEDDFDEEGITENGSGLGSYSSKLENLKPGTIFYARAYAVVDGTAYYGNQVSFRTADACFIATAAYGSLLQPQVQILRDFRDRFLLRTELGDRLVSFYYKKSPPIADRIAASPMLRSVMRVLLLPLVGLGWLAMHLSAAAWLAIAVSICTVTPSVMRVRRAASPPTVKM